MRYLWKKRSWEMLVLLLLVLGTFRYAAADTSRLSETEFTLYRGDSLQLAQYLSPELQGQNVSWALDSEGEACIAVTGQGQVSALFPGEAGVTVWGSSPSGDWVEQITVTVIQPQEIQADYGETVRLEAADNICYGAQDFWTDNASAAVSQGNITVQGFEEAGIYVTRADGSRVKVAQLEVQAPTVAGNDGIARALGSEPYMPELLHCEGEFTYHFACKSRDVVDVSSELLVPVALGSAQVELTIFSLSGQSISINIPVTVTDPSLREKEVVIAAGIYYEIGMDGLCPYSQIKWDSQSDILSVQGATLIGEKKGTEKVVLEIDGRELSFQAVITDPHYKGYGLVMEKGMKLNIGIKGLNAAKSHVTYISQNPRIAAVSSKGRVKAKKKGVTYIMAEADGKQLQVYVGVTTPKARKAVNREKAIARTRTKYSQARRMSKGYYDCSSLVWRSYSRYKVYLGVRSGWAPTAAGIAQWCQQHGKKLANRAIVNEKKLLPGDLIFYSTSKNGRYKNITHVETYIGNGMVISASSTYNAVVALDYYPSSSIVMMARPTA